MQERFQRICRACRLRFSVIKGAQIAQRLEKLRCKDQRKKAGEQRYAGAVMTEIKFAKVREAKVDGNNGNGQRGKKLQYR